VLLGGGYAAVVLGLGQLPGPDSSLAVAEETMQPTRASLWLRPPAPSTAVDGPAHGRLQRWNDCETARDCASVA
jgi:hypothetical protein